MKAGTTTARVGATHGETTTQNPRGLRRLPRHHPHAAANRDTVEERLRTGAATGSAGRACLTYSRERRRRRAGSQWRWSRGDVVIAGGHARTALLLDGLPACRAEVAVSLTIRPPRDQRILCQ